MDQLSQQTKSVENAINKIARTVTLTDDGYLVFNRSVKLEIVNWDEEAQS